MNRSHWQQLADARVLDSEALLNAGRWSAAYYLAGYAIECGLKACILAYVENNNADVLFRERRFQEKCWTHDLDGPLGQANLTRTLDEDASKNLRLEDHWDCVNEWKEYKRYDMIEEVDARALFLAVTDSLNGVLPWIKKRW